MQLVLVVHQDLNVVKISKMKTRSLLPRDWESVRRIYQIGMDTGLATFETEVPNWEKWDSKFLQACRLVAEVENEVVGWAVLSAVSSRWVYRGVAEVSIYVDLNCTHKGIGSVLMKDLIKETEKAGFWTLQSVIFSKNEPSIQLHKKFDFRVVGIRERIGQRDGEWKDTVLMERRSNLIN